MTSEESTKLTHRPADSTAETQDASSNKVKPKGLEAQSFDAPNKHVDASTSTRPEIARGQLLSRSDAPWWHSQFNLMLGVFSLLAVAALLFITLTPAPNTIESNTVINAQGQATQGESVANNELEQAAPFSTAQREQARQDSQDVLSELLDVKKALEEKQVSNWAADAFAAALTIAEQGDEAYQQQQYADSIALYKESVNALESIYDVIPAELSKRVADGLRAIREGKSELANDYFQAALSLDQNYVPALQGLQRVKTLDQVLALLNAAILDEQDFANTDALADIQQAKQQYQQALALDSAAEAAQQGLQRVSELETDKQYRIAMTQGFNALFAGQYSTARSGFNAALEHKPSDPTASNALRQALASDRRTSLRSLLSNAKSFEAKEQWSSALSNYQTVLQRDPNQVAAKIGSIRSQARVDLDRQIKQVLSDPLALSKATARERANGVLNDAKGISKKGPQLREQIASMEQALKQIDVNIKTVIASDSLTQVSLKKAGAKRINLGKFASKNLVLKPGRYTLVGTRLGYQDQRIELELTAQGEPLRSFTIVCDQRIIDAS